MPAILTPPSDRLLRIAKSLQDPVIKKIAETANHSAIKTVIETAEAFESGRITAQKAADEFKKHRKEFTAMMPKDLAAPAVQIGCFIDEEKLTRLGSANSRS